MPAAPPYWEAPTEALLAGCQVRGTQEVGWGHRRAGVQPLEARVQQPRKKPRTQKQAEDQEVEG